MSTSSEETCASCTWVFTRPGEPCAHRCRQRCEDRVDPASLACPVWEGPLDCLACGACCRSAPLVPVEPECPLTRREPESIEILRGRPFLGRSGGRCVFLQEDGAFWRCRVYADRPLACRRLEVGDDGCRWARRLHGMGPAR